MAQEFETQIIDIDVGEVEKTLRDLGAKEEPEILQRRWIYDITDHSKLGPGMGRWVRLRQAGEKITITYKYRRGVGVDETEEVEVEVADFGLAHEFLSKLPCFLRKNYQENKRRKFVLKDIEFTIDSWPLIPPILEIEGKSVIKVEEGLNLLKPKGRNVGHLGLIGIYKIYGIDLQSYAVLKFEDQKV